ncbi:cytidine deaminase [Basidiobolus meristosporus CBS 931.73]|uniref:Cytidine deaminase n=1 Tax=Basidiobolus meristosporus CBS 931.73 TaxID=1314790 RepID=A0A1Y1Y310_9FUNG|nr:cytidine deaminase [Basidiobolus meristosporus CBS 931.73]|eukprot:ORX92383.1 cytidine deaminase [Basidiobolus meristosporus CBS 931.73]
MAIEALDNSYAPYTNFKVGAALLTGGNHFYKGCNIENASLGAGICAERAAFARAWTDGEKKFLAVAIATDPPSFTFPCGTCRQFMAEWGTDLNVYAVKSHKSTQVLSLEELLPHRFTHHP